MLKQIQHDIKRKKAGLTYIINLPFLFIKSTIFTLLVHWLFRKPSAIPSPYITDNRSTSSVS